MESKDKQHSLKEQLKALKQDEKTLSIKLNTNRRTQQFVKQELWYVTTGINRGDEITFIEEGGRRKTKGILYKLDVDRSNIIFPIVRLYDKHHKPSNRERIISLDEQKTLEKA